MNAFADKLQRSWQLFNRSVLVIREHPALLVFPVLTGLLTLTIALFFLVPVGLVLLAPHWVDGTKVQALAHSIGFLKPQGGGNYHFQIQPLGTAILAFMYLVNLFLATMCSVAFNHQILEALNGRPVSIDRGIAAACARWKSVLMWSLLAGLVGLFIRAVEERLAFVGRLVAGLLGVAWSVASVFAIPILARETSFANPLQVLAKSGQTIKRTWGEMLVGYVGMQGTNIMVVWASILFWIAAGASAYLLSNPWVLLFAGVPWLLGLLAYCYLAGIASRVYLCALYLYATDGSVPGYFDATMMDMGWKMKKR